MTTPLARLADLVTDCPNRGVRPVVALENVESLTGQLIDPEALTERDAPDAGAAAIDPGTVLFGKLRPYLGKSWLADRPVYASTELLALRPRESVDGRWLAYLCLSKPFIEWAVATSDGTKMPRTSWEKLRAFKVSAPPPMGQREVADFLDAETARIEALVEKKQVMVALIDEHKWSTVDARFAAIDEPMQALGRSIVSACDGPFGSSLTSAHYSDDGARVIRLGNIGRVAFRDEDRAFIPLQYYSTLRRHEVWPGDLLVAGLGDENQPLGRACIAPPGIGQSIVKADCFRVRLDLDRLLANYAAWWLSSSRGGSLVAESARGSTRQRMNIGSLSAIPIPVPSRSVQETLVRGLDEVSTWASRTTEAISAQIDLLREHRQALITAAVTGELGVAKAAA